MKLKEKGLVMRGIFSSKARGECRTNPFLVAIPISDVSEVFALKPAEEADSWWERANKKLAETTLKTRFRLNTDGRVEVDPLFEIVDDVFSMLQEEADEAELDQPDS